MEELFNSREKMLNGLVNINKFLNLNNKEHIKKYYKARKLHSEIIDSMMNYIDTGKLPVIDYLSLISDDIKKEIKKKEFSIDNREYNDSAIFNELFIYKTYAKIPSLTEMYLEKKKFRNPSKIKMLEAMRDSVVGLFKIVGYDSKNGYVTYQDVFTKRRYTVIDISMSSLSIINNYELYIYNRIITYDGIRFGTGIPCVIRGNNKELKEFIKNYNYKKCSDFSRCLILYDIFKNSDNLGMSSYHNY